MDDLATQVAKKVVEDTKYFAAVIGLIGVLIGGFITIVGNIIAHWLNARKERRQELLRRELDRFFKLEELAGELTEWISSYQLSSEDTAVSAKLKLLSIEAGRFRRYTGVKQAVRDLHNCLSRLMDAQREHEDDRDIRKELEQKYSVLITACDKVVGKRET